MKIVNRHLFFVHCIDREIFRNFQWIQNFKYCQNVFKYKTLSEFKYLFIIIRAFGYQTIAFKGYTVEGYSLIAESSYYSK